jgi:hypothetical protein
LDDEVDMSRPALCMRPQAAIHLVGWLAGIGPCFRDGSRYPYQEWTDLDRLGYVEPGELGDVPLWLDHDGPYAQRTHAVFDDPATNGRNPATRDLIWMGIQLAGEASHGL